MSSDIHLYQQRTNLLTWLAASLALVAGILLLVASQHVAPESVWQFLWGTLGSLLIATTALSLLWELAAKRSFLAEILAHTRLARQIDQTGVVGLPIKWNQDIQWAQLLRETSHVDVFVAYGNNWRGAHGDEWKRFAQRKGTSCRVILPDPDNSEVIAALSCQFNRPPDLIRGRILEAAADFSAHFGSGSGDQSRCAVFFHSRPPLFSFFIFGDTAVLTLYKHNPSHLDIIGLLLRRGGKYFEFLESELDAMISSQSRQPNEERQARTKRSE